MQRYLASILLNILLSTAASQSCGITSTSVQPQNIYIDAPYAIITCVHEPHLAFNSFYHPSGATLTSDIAPKFRINNINGRAELTIQPIAESDQGSYSCNFRNQQNQPCSRVVEVTFVNSVEFCTPNDLRYHATVGDSVTLECSAKNYDVLRWSKGQSNTAIDLSDPHVSMNGTNLRISPVSVEDRGEYKCIAENEYFTAQDISATLEVYLMPTVTITPLGKVVNASDRAELACDAQGFPLPDVVWSREDTTGLQTQAGVIDIVERTVNVTTKRSTLTFHSVREEDTGTYRCTASNLNGSIGLTASLQLFGTPSAPLGVELTIINQTNILVEWLPPQEDGHLDILGYNVMWSSRPNHSDLVSHNVNGSAGHYIITHLRPVTNYTVIIYAKNSIGKGKGSDERNITTLPTAPDAPSHVFTHQITATSVQIEYTISRDNGSPVTKLRVYYQAGNEEEKFTDTTITVPPVTQSYQLNNLKGDTPYTIRVSAGNSVGFGPVKEWSFKTLRPGYPATPSSVRAQEVQATTVKLVWEVAEVGKPYTYYYISALVNGSVSKGQSFTVKSEDVRRSGLEETATLSDLTQETCYTFTVAIENSEGRGHTSPASPPTCTPSCKEAYCETVGGVSTNQDDTPSAHLVPILIVTIIVAILVVLVVIIVAILSRRYSNKHKATVEVGSSLNQNFATASLNSSHFGNSLEHSHSQFSAGSVSHASSSFTYHHQHSIASQNSSSITDPDEAPTTGSTIVSESPFYFSAGPNQNGSSQYVNGTIQYGAPYPNATIHSDYPQQIGVKVAAAGSYPLFPIPENTVAMGHFPVSTPIVAVPSHNEATFMTDNPAFEKPQNIGLSPHNAADELDEPEDTTPPPIPPYRGDSYSDTESAIQPQVPQIHVHQHIQNQNSHTRIPPRSQSTQSVPYLGESFSQASRSPAMPRADFFLPDGEEEEDEVEFMENNAYESVSPQPVRREFILQGSASATVMRAEFEAPTRLKFKTSSLQRSQDSSPTFPRREHSPSTTSGSIPRFEISSQERGLVFETVKIKNKV